MRINGLNLLVTKNTKTDTNIRKYPSFGKSVKDDEFVFSSGISSYIECPDILLKKVKQSGKDAEGVNELFEAIISERGKEIKLMKKQEEKEKLKEELCQTYGNSPLMFLRENASEAEIDYFSRPIKTKINNILRSLGKYENLDEPDNKKFRLLGKTAKILAKKDSFNPNHICSDGLRLINHTINSDDDELSLVIIRHKNFKCPDCFIDSPNKEKYNYLEKKSKSFFARLFC